MPKVSIIVPVYNVEKYLRQCLDSVLNQTFQEFEAICINDGSTDSCAQILDEYAKKDSRIKVIYQENKGLSEARNTGLKHVQGDYVFFLDSDDSIHPQCLDICHSFIQKDNADMVSFHFSEQIENSLIDIDEITYKVTDSPLSYFCHKSKYRVLSSVWSKLYRVELIKGVSFIPGIHFEDWPLVCAILAKNPKTVLCKEKLYFYTQNPNSITHQQRNPKQIQDYFCGLKYVIGYCKSNGYSDKLKQISHFCFAPILKQQLNHCFRADQSVQPKMFQEFAMELKYLDEHGLLYWHHHKLSRYLKYRKLIKKV